MGASSDEFPLLSALGLYATDIRGDGNCLFNALSDQLYGHQKEHSAIRSKVIDYMREHASYYKQFIDVHPGGGIRRNPKRKNAGAYSSPAAIVPPSEADIDRVFEGHLESMARGGTYGDNMEITAFSSAYGVDVKIYQRDFAYMVTGGGPDSPRGVAHIAYHLWEHYSSIRNLDGPHSGLPEVQIRALSPQEEQKQKDKLASTPHVIPWMVDSVSRSLPFLADKSTITRALEECKGNIDVAVSKLMDAEEGGSLSSAQESSSIEREVDSDDDAYTGPNKKQDRRLSRATRKKASDIEHRQVLSKLATHDSSQESFSSQDTEASSTDSQSHPNQVKSEHNDAGDTIDVRKPSASAARPPIKLKLKAGSQVSPNIHDVKDRPKQTGPARVSARDRRDIKKQAQKAARKERQQASAKGVSAAMNVGISLRDRKLTETPPIESGFRTLFI